MKLSKGDIIKTHTGNGDLLPPLTAEQASHLTYIAQAKIEWEATVDVIPQIICLLDEQQRITRTNQTVERWGLGSVRAVRGWTLPHLLHGTSYPDSADYLHTLLEQTWYQLQTRPSVEYEQYDAVLQRNLRFLFRAMPPTASSDCVVIVLIEDVTAYKEMEAHNRLVSEARYRAIVEDQTDLICRFWPDTTLTFVNRVYRRYFNLSEAELLETRFDRFVPPDALPELQAHLAALTPERPIDQIQYPVTLSMGEVRWQEWSHRAIFDQHNQVIEIQGVGRDITQRREIENQLRLFEAAAHHSTDAIIITDPQQPDNPVIYANPAFEKKTGYQFEQIKGQNLRFLKESPPDTEWYDDYFNESDFDTLRQAIKRGENCRVLLRNYRQNGAPFWNDLTIYPLRDKSGRLTHFVGIQRDVTAQKNLEMGLASLHELGQQLTALRDEVAIIEACVKTVASLLGTQQAVGYGEIDEATNQLCYRYHYADGCWLYNQACFSLDQDVSIGVAVTQSGKMVYVPDTQLDCRHVDGLNLKFRAELNVPVKIQARPIGVLNVQHPQPHAFSETEQQLLQTLADQMGVAIENARLYDMERQQRLALEQSQTALIQSEKMAAMGRLVASIAHEINNPLQAVQMGLSLIQETLTDEEYDIETILDYLETVSDELVRTTNLVTRMRDFYKPTPKLGDPPAEMTVEQFYNLVKQAEYLNVQQVLESVLKLVDKHLQRHNIRLTYKPLSEPPLIRARADYLRQVFINLILNAIDSMTDTEKQLVIQLDDTGPCWLVISFADTGCGIPPETLPHIFEPMFTTKSHGSGLGLFTCYKIIEAHQGYLDVTCQVGLGSTFTVSLPTDGRA